MEIPASLLTAPDLPVSAKLIRVLHRLHPGAGAARLAELSGLSLPTVHKGLSLLPSCPAWSGQRSATIPDRLLTDTNLSARARLLYGVLQLLPQAGQFTFPTLSRLAQASSNALREPIEELTAAGWLHTHQANRSAAICFTLGDPWREEAEARAVEAELRLTEWEYKGEALMREYLSLIVATDHYVDNARPGYLVNPMTGELLEFDRYYPPSVAFEFNGPHHFRATRRIPKAQSDRQRTRDLIKMGYCLEKGINLVVVVAGDLTLKTMQKKVGQLLPCRDLRGLEPLADFLDKVSRNYGFTT